MAISNFLLLCTLLLLSRSQRVCPRGTYNNTATSSCLPCPTGYFNPHRGAVGVDLCEPCPANTFLPVSGGTSVTSCRPCPPNTSSVPGSSLCIPSCPSNQILGACSLPLPLPFFPRFPLGRVNVCYQYDSYFDIYEVAETPSLSCRDCPARFFKPSSDNFCLPCPPGLLSDEGATSCKTCPPGTGGFSLRAGRLISCVPCTGLNAFNDGSSGFCEACPPGQIANKRRGATGCVPCPQGTRKGPDDERCRACPSGQNSDVRGAQICQPDNTPCASNQVHTRTGACRTCPKNWRFDKRLGDCVKCKNGFAGPGGISTRCRKCPRNAVADPQANRGCLCKPGFAFTRDFRCVPCRPGTARSGDGSRASEACFRCGPGMIAPRRGMKKCIKCPRGQVQPLMGQTRCMRCPKGTKPQQPNQENCVSVRTNCRSSERRVIGFRDDLKCEQIPGQECPNGTTNVGSRRFPICSVCEAPEMLNERTGRCRRCPNGQFVGQGGKCEICPKRDTVSVPIGCGCPGEFMDEKGRCSPCPDGTVPDGRFGCKTCPSGTFSRPGFCELCQKGRFSEEGAVSCTKCPDGTTTLGKGAGSCVRIGSLAM